MTEPQDVNDRSENYDATTGEFVFQRCFSCEPNIGREVWVVAAGDSHCAHCGCDVPHHLKREPDHD